MAEAKSTNSLASTIRKNFLECSICCGPFDDPRALPCLHPFCCGCLENWVKAYSKSRKTVSCPLCKMVYGIPEEEGIKGFPAHFLVTDLQSTVDTAKQTDSSVSDDDGHNSCSDFGFFDPTCDRGNDVVRLNFALKQQRTSLENLVRRVRAVDAKYVAASRLTANIRQDIDRATEAKIKAIDQDVSYHMHQVGVLAKANKHAVYRKQEEKVATVDRVQDKLQVDLACIRSACEHASNVVDSGSDSDVASLLLSSTLEQLAQCEPPTPTVESTLGELELPHNTQVDLSSLEQLLCGKLHITPCTRVTNKRSSLSAHFSPPPASAEHMQSAVGSPLVQESSGAHSWLTSSGTPSILSRKSSSKASSGTPSITSQASSSRASGRTNYLSTSPFGVPQASQISMLPSFLPLAFAQSCKSWRFCRKVKTAPHAERPCGIAIDPINEDIVVTCDLAPVSVFSLIGPNYNFIWAIEGSPTCIVDLAITANIKYIIPDKNEFHIYDRDGTLDRTFPVYDVNNRRCRPTSVAVDSTGRIIVALGPRGLGRNVGYNAKTVSIHYSDGSVMSKFETTSSPRMLTCTPDDQLVISFTDNSLQIMDQSGRNIRVIQPPPHVVPWAPWHVCCSKKGVLFVGNWGYPGTEHAKNQGVYRYVCTGVEYEYLDCITTAIGCPWGIALSPNEDKLFVVNNRSSVTIFEEI